MNIELNIFTNCTPYAPSTKIIRATYESFKQAFGELVPTVWCDPHPKKKSFSQYYKNLKINFPSIISCQSLSDGYIKAILKSNADYLFMLEHDWIFNAELIKHSLQELIEAMNKIGIYHLRFNKHANYPTRKFDSRIVEYTKHGLTFCTTPFLSNNPHIINRKKYIEFVKNGYIRVENGSYGIEQRIGRIKGTWGALYGPKDYPAIISHLDGSQKKGRRR